MVIPTFLLNIDHIETRSRRQRLRVRLLFDNLQQNIRGYVTQLAKDEDIYNKIKNSKRYFAIIVM